MNIQPTVQHIGKNIGFFMCFCLKMFPWQLPVQRMKRSSFDQILPAGMYKCDGSLTLEKIPAGSGRTKELEFLQQFWKWKQASAWEFSGPLQSDWQTLVALLWLGLQLRRYVSCNYFEVNYGHINWMLTIFLL